MSAWQHWQWLRLYVWHSQWLRRLADPMHELDGVYTVHTEPTRVLMSRSMPGTRLSLEPVALSKRFLAWRNRKYFQTGGNSRKPIQLQFLNNLYIYLYCTSSPGYNTLFLYINIPFSCPPLLSPNFPLYSRMSHDILG